MSSHHKNTKTSKSSLVVPPGMPVPANSLNNIIGRMSPAERDSHRTAFLEFLHVLVGNSVTVDSVNGTSYSGVFYTATPFEDKAFRVALKCAQETNPSNAKVSEVNIKPGSTLILDKENFESLSVKSVDISTKSLPAELQIDSSIRNKNIAHLEGRSLENVSSSWLDGASLDDDISMSGNANDWNQFETNRKLFNVQSTYDENLYTKKLDFSILSREAVAQAERLAREIESSTSSNIHMQEERGHALQRDMDEEDLYSGVLRDPITVKPVVSPADANVWSRRSAQQNSNTSSPVVNQNSSQNGQNKNSSKPNLQSPNKSIKSANSSHSNTPPSGKASSNSWRNVVVENKSKSTNNAVNSVNNDGSSTPSTLLINSSITPIAMEEPDDDTKSTNISGANSAIELKVEGSDNLKNEVDRVSVLVTKSTDESHSDISSDACIVETMAKEVAVKSTVEVDVEVKTSSTAVNSGSKLNPNAKAFVFNANTPDFVPTGYSTNSGTVSVLQQQLQQQSINVQPTQHQPNQMINQQMSSPGQLPQPHMQLQPGSGQQMFSTHMLMPQQQYSTQQVPQYVGIQTSMDQSAAPQHQLAQTQTLHAPQQHMQILPGQSQLQNMAIQQQANADVNSMQGNSSNIPNMQASHPHHQQLMPMYQQPNIASQGNMYGYDNGGQLYQGQVIGGPVYPMNANSAPNSFYQGPGMLMPSIPGMVGMQLAGNWNGQSSTQGLGWPMTMNNQQLNMNANMSPGINTQMNQQINGHLGAQQANQINSQYGQINVQANQISPPIMPPQINSASHLQYMPQINSQQQAMGGSHGAKVTRTPRSNGGNFAKTQGGRSTPRSGNNNYNNNFNNGNNKSTPE